MRGRHSILADVTLAYGHSRDRYERAMGRGDQDRADDAMSEMQQIENSITVIETNTEWRAVLERRRGN